MWQLRLRGLDRYSEKAMKQGRKAGAELLG
jgi:hypothetical protein